MLLTVQPDVLSGLMGNVAFRGRGLCARFLYACCKSKIGARTIDPEPITLEVKENYFRFVRHILLGDDTGVIRFGNEARKKQIEYSGIIERRLDDDWEHMRDWGSKAVGAMLRIAALIHAAESERPTETPVDGETVARAIAITEFLGVHAVAAYQSMGANKDHEDAKYLLRRFRKTGLYEISKRDLFNMCKGKFVVVDAMEPALQVLVNMNYIVEIEQATKGRPTKKLILNPYIQKVQKVQKGICKKHFKS